jgi:ankyrin repeat protein
MDDKLKILDLIKKIPTNTLKEIVNKTIKISTKENSTSYTLLSIAAENQDILAIKKLLECGAHVDYIPSWSGYKQNHTPLMSYLWNPKIRDQKENLEIVKLFVSYGADINLIPESNGGYSFNAWTIAYDKGHFEISRELLRTGADIQTARMNIFGGSKAHLAKHEALKDLAHNEYKKYVSNPDQYIFPSKMHSNTKEALMQYKCTIDSKKSEITVSYDESAEYFDIRKAYDKENYQFSGCKEGEYNSSTKIKCDIHKKLNNSDGVSFLEINKQAKSDSNSIGTIDDLFDFLSVDKVDNQDVKNTGSIEDAVQDIM